MDTEQVKKLAHLARLNVPENELETVAKDIGAIIGFVDVVQTAELSEENAQERESVNIFRDDIVEPIGSAHDLVEAAPLHKDHFVQVAKVIE
ncbi:MAG TPA: Asp-tRNA(Asn)/Glu-tRNA(Gln) amidotransferase subunit GatC [Candidatus Paceibacterota bacterium]